MLDATDSNPHGWYGYNTTYGGYTTGTGARFYYTNWSYASDTFGTRFPVRSAYFDMDFTGFTQITAEITITSMPNTTCSLVIGIGSRSNSSWPPYLCDSHSFSGSSSIGSWSWTMSIRSGYIDYVGNNFLSMMCAGDYTDDDGDFRKYQPNATVTKIYCS